MSLNLTIENETRLPDGGSLTYRLKGQRGADIGRDAHLDWTLPDPSRYISGKHCEIRYRDGGYWLSDVSRNGIFLNGNQQRIQSPYRLRNGDRLTIGHYIVAVDVVAEAEEEAQPERSVFEDFWAGDAAPPLPLREMRASAQSAPVRPDFMEWGVDLPIGAGSGFVARPTPPPAVSASDPMSWDAGSMPRVDAPAPAPPVPTPRRSIWVSPGPAGRWGGDNMPAPSGDTPSVPGYDASAPSPAIIDRFAKGAGLAPDTLASQSPGDLVERLGRLMLLVTDNLMQLLNARSETKRIARSSQKTMIAALDNNPLKFSPTAADALRIMLGPPNSGYLDFDRALQQSFDDLKSHQVKTFAAMQIALTTLLEDMAPASLERDLGMPSRLVRWLGLRKARLWMAYEARWQIKTRGGGNMQALFMQLFTDAYDQSPGALDRNGRSDI